MSKQPTTWEEHAELSSAFSPDPEAAAAVRIAPDQKWIAVSQLHKAIRRARPEIAVAWARALWEADRSYGLFRMAVIACEEVACADPALARGYLQSEIKRAWFDDRGGFGAMAYFVDAFARSPKDRTSCDLASTASASRLADVDLGGRAGRPDFPALRALAQDEAASAPARLSALWLLAGTRKVPCAELGAPKEGHHMSYLGACAAIEPDPDAIACSELSLRLNKEPNGLALPLCRQAQRAAPPTIASGARCPTIVRGWGLTAALDAHTREGRAALEELLVAEPGARELCARAGSRADKVKALGSVFFRLEGREVEPRLQYPLAAQADAWHEQRVARLLGIPAPDAFARAEALLPALDELRARQAPWALGGARPGAGFPKP